MAMTGNPATPSLLRFHCPSCRAELTVPAHLAGVEGPCPSCYQTIRAPIPEAVNALQSFPAGPVNVVAPPEFNTPAMPTGSPAPVLPIPIPQRPAGIQADFPQLGQEKGFKARLAIPAADEPLDDTWKDRHREQTRQNRRARKVESVAHSFLESRGFALVRASMILISAGLLVWLLMYMKDHQWKLPGMSAPPVATEKPGGKVRSAAGDANQLVADDGLEIPTAANETPKTAPAANGGAPVASPVP